jgi:hypothetical protein
MMKIWDIHWDEQWWFMVIYPVRNAAMEKSVFLHGVFTCF